ncbi:alpha/beta hydrolase [Paenibacillus hexagrammi]|uniref:Esterase n=1 Tax=Paenibacillus hexagrammi TaxID=2908839 RepID=A0ABY3SCR4_9BACL|nr:alpha/beta hydrolase-fold protein [Paenibacillus sp. YPD9-1]UJF31788.1 hypothetical protein L0M14_18680 [Paenibacillus sp. YPD9-1]
MAFMQVEFFSEVLGLSSSIDVIVPQRAQGQVGITNGAFEPPYPVLYLLHGGSDNHTNWRRNTSIERYVSSLGLVVVMPAVQYSFYSNQKYGFNYFTYLSEELPRIVQDFFHVSGKREDTFAAGLSMGGTGRLSWVSLARRNLQLLLVYRAALIRGADSQTILTSGIQSCCRWRDILSVPTKSMTKVTTIWNGYWKNA